MRCKKSALAEAQKTLELVMCSHESRLSDCSSFNKADTQMKGMSAVGWFSTPRELHRNVGGAIVLIDWQRNTLQIVR